MTCLPSLPEAPTPPGRARAANPATTSRAASSETALTACSAPTAISANGWQAPLAVSAKASRNSRANHGPARGNSLEAVPLEWTTWGSWRTLHPDTAVLSTTIGYLRPYGTDPYGGYQPLSGYYSDGNIIFPVMRRSRRFPAKEVFIAVTHGQAHIAARKQSLRDHGVLTANAAGAPVIFLYAPALDDGSAFLPHTSGGLLRLAPVAGRPGYYRDAASGSVWDSSGAAVQGPSRDAMLPRLPAFNVMWFAWYAFFPATGVLG